MILTLEVGNLDAFFLDLYWSQCDECSDGESVFWSKVHQGFHHKPRGGPCNATVVRKKVWDYFGEEPAHLSQIQSNEEKEEEADLKKGSNRARRNRKRRDKKTASPKHRSSSRSKTRKA